MAGELDDLANATVRAWATAARAWFEAANAIWAGWVDLAATETDRKAFNEELVAVPAQPTATALHPGEFTDVDDDSLPAEAIEVLPPQVGPGGETEVRVRVHPPPDTPSGTYTGTLCDAPGGNPVVEAIGIYVVGDRVP